MAKITFKNRSISIEVEQGTKLSDCIRLAELFVETPCSGMGTCGKCKVKAIGKLTSITDKERKYIREELNERLACTTGVLGDVEIEIVGKDLDLKTINEGYSISTSLNSDIGIVKLPGFDKTSSVPYIESWGYKVSPGILNKIFHIDKSIDRNIEGVLYKDEIIDIGNSMSKLLGVAIDIGTTGISAYLIDIKTGETLNKRSTLNSQTEYGGDVLSRITYSIGKPDGKRNLKKAVISNINNMIAELLGDPEDLKDIYRVVVAANTVMLHMLLGIDTETIAKSPYRPIFLESLDIRGKDMGIEINNRGVVTLLPSASAYVGADIIAGAVATGFNNKEYKSIFIDIGTNGEILIISGKKIIGTSTAAGPAFEGMNISCGCRAEDGAIDTFKIENDGIRFTTINNKSVKGICGSGLIDIVAELINNKIILKSGRLNKKLEGKLGERIKDKKFYITDDIYLSQGDIRQVQLAKGAIAAGIKVLLQGIDITIDEIKEVVVAGSFGYHLNPESIKKIGIIPKGFRGDIIFSGNSSVEGARLALINKNILDEMKRLKDKINILELSTKQEFQDCFVEELSF